MKIKKTGIIAIFFMLIMLLSTFAFSFIQSGNTSDSGPATLPEDNIIYYELTFDQENLAIGKGFTVAKFYYYTTCIDCGDRLSLLEYMANNFPSQVMVQEITTNGTTSLSMRSYLGEKNLVNATQEQIFKAFCDLMVKPPITCAVQ